MPCLDKLIDKFRILLFFYFWLILHIISNGGKWVCVWELVPRGRTTRNKSSRIKSSKRSKRSSNSLRKWPKMNRSKSNLQTSRNRILNKKKKNRLYQSLNKTRSRPKRTKQRKKLKDKSKYNRKKINSQNFLYTVRAKQSKTTRK